MHATMVTMTHIQDLLCIPPRELDPHKNQTRAAPGRKNSREGVDAILHYHLRDALTTEQAVGVSSISMPLSTSARLAHTREVARAGWRESKMWAELPETWRQEASLPYVNSS